MGDNFYFVHHIVLRKQNCPEAAQWFHPFFFPMQADDAGIT
jgi:hypothetical protein